ncbi:uncharacterized protein LOC141731520 [Zonotrichia albicollis]|uniref:uncharacterized protein LOC141731520 n=1 Tax=Zonotrichia albicollis TaxID=44394 RepID=UPI003D80DFAC
MYCSTQQRGNYSSNGNVSPEMRPQMHPRSGSGQHGPARLTATGPPAGLRGRGALPPVLSPDPRPRTPASSEAPLCPVPSPNLLPPPRPSSCRCSGAGGDPECGAAPEQRSRCPGLSPLLSIPACPGSPNPVCSGTGTPGAGEPLSPAAGAGIVSPPPPPATPEPSSPPSRRVRRAGPCRAVPCPGLGCAVLYRARGSAALVPPQRPRPCSGAASCAPRAGSEPFYRGAAAAIGSRRRTGFQALAPLCGANL